MTFSNIFPVNTYGTRPVVIMDGGMGTTLATPPFSEGLDSTLWSSELLQSKEGRKKLENLNEYWIENGAELIGSCTYQSSLPLFLSSSQQTQTSTSSNIDVEVGLETMLAAIPIVTKPYSCSNTSFKSRSSKPFSMLSLGPLGAQLSPGQEYGGNYPPPFGNSPNTSPSKLPYSEEAIKISIGLNCTIPSTHSSIEDALTTFHLTRLLQFSQSVEFDNLTLIAFETVPNIVEIRSIRRTMYLFNNHPTRISKPSKPFFISYVFPIPKSNSEKSQEGPPGEEDKNNSLPARYPDESYRHLPTSDLIDLLVSTTFTEEFGGYERSDGLGINCTNPNQLLRLVKMISKSLIVLEGGRGGKRPWLVLYPDGGSVYDVVTRTWSNPDGMDSKTWSSILSTSISLALKSRYTVTESGSRPSDTDLWGGVIAGGCCKANGKAIKALREKCIEEGWIDN